MMSPNATASRSRGPRPSPRRGLACVLSLCASCLEPALAHAELPPARAQLAAARAEPARGLERGPARAFEPVERPPAEAAPDESLELRVSYRAPSDCPSSGAFLEALQQHVAAGGGGAIDAEVSIARASESQFELALRLRVAGAISESRARAESCLALVQLAALNASMARTAALPAPGALGAPAPGSEPSPQRSAAALAPPPDTANEGGAPGAPAARVHLRPSLTADVRTQSGMLPARGWGQGLTLGVGLGAVSLRLSGTAWHGQRHRFAPEDSSEVSLEFEQRSLALSPCAGHALSPLLRLDGCLSLAAHRVSAGGGSHVIGALGVAALATLSPWRGLRVELEGGLSASLERPQFGVLADPYLYQPEVLQPGARVAVGWDFGGGT